MARLEKVQFAVTGSGNFPVDMLRYDECWPASSSDAFAMSDPGKRRVALYKYVERGALWPVAVGRWESFGWKVTQEPLKTGMVFSS